MPRRGNDNLDSLLTAQYDPTTTCYRCPVHSTQYPRGSLGVVWEGGGICTHATPINSAACSCLRGSPILSRRGFFRQGPDSEPSTNLSSACPGRARISGDTPLLEQYVVEASDKQAKSSSAWAEASRRDPYVDSPLAVTFMYSVLRPYSCSRTVLGGFDGTGAGLAGSRGSAVR